MKACFTHGNPWYGKFKEYILHKCAFYECHDCKKPFYGGTNDCAEELDLASSTNKEDLKCRSCVIKMIGGGQYNCSTHGHKFITWKCHLCCKEALFRCGISYFCESCHRDGGVSAIDCKGKNCPLGVPHPPAGDPIKSMYPLGCSLCRVRPE